MKHRGDRRSEPRGRDAVSDGAVYVPSGCLTIGTDGAAVDASTGSDETTTRARPSTIPTVAGHMASAGRGIESTREWRMGFSKLQ